MKLQNAVKELNALNARVNEMKAELAGVRQELARVQDGASGAILNGESIGAWQVKVQELKTKETLLVDAIETGTRALIEKGEVLEGAQVETDTQELKECVSTLNQGVLKALSSLHSMVGELSELERVGLRASSLVKKHPDKMSLSTSGARALLQVLGVIGMNVQVALKRTELMAPYLMKKIGS